MRRFNPNTWKGGGVGACIAASLLFATTSTVHAIDTPPSSTVNDLNVVAANNSPAVFVLYPRKLVDPNLEVNFESVYVEGDDRSGTALEINAWRQRALSILTASNQTEFATTVGRHQLLAFGAHNLVKSGVSAEDSRLIFTNEITSSISTLLGLDTFITLDQLTNVDSGSSVSDNDLEAMVDTPLRLLVRGDAATIPPLDAATINEAALDNNFDFTNFQFCILLLASGDPNTGANRIALSEYICIDANPDRVRPVQVFLSVPQIDMAPIFGEPEGGSDSRLYIVASQQLGDEADGRQFLDFTEGGGFFPDSFNDTVLEDLSTNSFRVRLGANPSQTLAEFLQSSVFDDGGPISGLVRDFYVGGVDFFNKILRIDFSRDLTDDEVAAFLARELRFNTSDIPDLNIPEPDQGGEGDPDGDTNSIFGVGGTIADDSVTGFAPIQLAQGLTIDNALLLQGSGPDITKQTRQIWVAVTFTELLDPEEIGSGNQFLLCANGKDGVERVVAVSDIVQRELPSNTEVFCIDDANDDGTTGDNVIDEQDDRLFVRFFLVTPFEQSEGDTEQNAINSDATWSPFGDCLTNDFVLRTDRSFRSQVSIKPNPEAGSFAAGLLGGVLDPEQQVDLGDLARPIPVEFVTRATNAHDGLCEFVDRLDLIFDESVMNPVAGRMILGYNECTISDLTTGLDGNLNIPEIDALEADFEDRIFGPVTGAALMTTHVANDTVRFNAAEIPVDGTANDGSSEILAGTGFVGGCMTYFLGLDKAAVEDVGASLGNTPIGEFDDGELLGDVAHVTDGAPPALLGGTYADCEIVAGFSEPITRKSPTSNEAESYFFIMDKTPLGVRVEFPDASIGGPFDNKWSFDHCLDEDVLEDPGYNLGFFNPGFPVSDEIFDDCSCMNRIDPNVAKTKMVMLMTPGPRFDDCGIAFVNDANKVFRILLFTDGCVELNPGGSLTELAGRFFIRGSSNDGFTNNGEPQTLAGLVQSITIGTQPLQSGFWPLELILMSGMEFPQDHFWVEYVAPADDDEFGVSLPGSHLVDCNDPSTQVPSENIMVEVIRAPPAPVDGNPLTQTIVGRLRLGPDADPLASRIDAFVFKPVGGCGVLTFTYKGVTYTGRIAATNSIGEPFAHGTRMYFHPQLMGSTPSDDDCPDCDGTMTPMGIVNFKPDLDIMYTTDLVTTQQGTGGSGGNGGVNAQNGANFIVTTQQVLLYQYLNDLNSNNIVKPIQLTFNAVNNQPGIFNVNGSGISNGRLRFVGAFEQIGRAFVDGPVDANNSRPFTIHTRGHKSYAGCPVVLVVCPHEKLTGIDPFLANNLLVRRIPFQSDIDRVGAAAGPVRFDINLEQIGSFSLSSLTPDYYSTSKQGATECWAMLPASRNNHGFDFGSGNALPNRVRQGGNPVNATQAFSANNTARGFFVLLNKSSKCPEMPDISMVLAIDNRGVYCGEARGLNRVAWGYGYAIQFSVKGSKSNYCWFNFGAYGTSGMELLMQTNNSNGGWNLLSTFGADSSFDADAFPGVVAITMDASGVKIGGELVDPDFQDLDTIGPDTAVLTFQNVNNLVLTP